MNKRTLENALTPLVHKETDSVAISSESGTNSLLSHLNIQIL